MCTGGSNGRQVRPCILLTSAQHSQRVLVILLTSASTARKCWCALDAATAAMCGGRPFMSTGMSLSPCCSNPVLPQPHT